MPGFFLKKGVVKSLNSGSLFRDRVLKTVPGVRAALPLLQAFYQELQKPKCNQMKLVKLEAAVVNVLSDYVDYETISSYMKTFNAPGKFRDPDAVSTWKQFIYEQKGSQHPLVTELKDSEKLSTDSFFVTKRDENRQLPKIVFL